jgi:hypothetical protein
MDRPAPQTILWTAAQDAVMRDMLSMGVSFSVIGNAINRSRCAVAGRAKRLGLCKEAVPKAVAAPKVRLSEVTKRVTLPALRRAEKLAEKIENERRAEAIENGVSIVDLERRHCRFIIGYGADTLARYCGVTHRANSSYCAEHHAIIYTGGRR